MTTLLGGGGGYLQWHIFMPLVNYIAHSIAAKDHLNDYTSFQRLVNIFIVQDFFNGLFYEVNLLLLDEKGKSLLDFVAL